MAPAGTALVQEGEGAAWASPAPCPGKAAEPSLAPHAHPPQGLPNAWGRVGARQGIAFL